MSRENEDETAAALRRLAEGQDDPAHDDAPPSESIIPMEAPQIDPQVRRARPAAPGASNDSEASKSPARPARPSRPTAPPTLTEQQAVNEEPAPPEEAAFVADDDDDVVIAPAPAPEVFAKRSSAVVQGPSLGFRRTLIPILLTFGVALPVTGAWWFTLDGESPLKVIGMMFPITMMVLGIMLLGLAALNMAQVRRILMHSSGKA